jgi:hypothetical protein
MVTVATASVATTAVTDSDMVTRGPHAPTHSTPDSEGAPFPAAASTVSSRTRSSLRRRTRAGAARGVSDGGTQVETPDASRTSSSGVVGGVDPRTVSRPRTEVGTQAGLPLGRPLSGDVTTQTNNGKGRRRPARGAVVAPPPVVEPSVGSGSSDVGASAVPVGVVFTTQARVMAVVGISAVVVFFIFLVFLWSTLVPDTPCL